PPVTWCGRRTRASRLVDDLLLMARVDRGLELSLAPADLREIVDAEAARARLVHPGLTLDTEIPDAAVPVSVDRDRIAQVLSNLVENAARVTGGRGRVVLGIHSPGDDVEVRVSDDGPGVAAEDRERIFDRLVRLDPARAGSGGVGLGLPIARGIARAHGGDVRCLPAESGAVFVLRLPRSAAPIQRAGRAAVGTQRAGRAAVGRAGVV
ncbi:sensor histidine kinase KdpD, partial [Microbacterium sp. B19]|uniref:sensor histidine kinase n=1 Tax=Microbacterium sp. B19 TaxID=96765 RepID=UPI0003B3522B